MMLIVCSHSLGQSAVFLIGGKTKETVPVPILLNSGDIVVMSQESRLAYHGIPRITSCTTNQPVPSCLSVESLIACTCCTKGHRSRATVENTDSEVAKPMSRTIFMTNQCSDCLSLASNWDCFIDYIALSRININVRQVLSEQFKFT